MASNQNRKRSKQHESVLETAMKRFDEAWDYAKRNHHDDWKRNNKLYNSERVYAQYKGVTDTFVPITYSTIETYVAAMNNANLRFDYKSNDPLRQVSTAPLNALIDEWWDQDQWDLLMEESDREMFITGMAGHFVSWDLDHPHIEHYAMYDVMVDPTVRHPRELQEPGHYSVRRYLVRKGSLEDFEVVDTDEESKTYGEIVKRFKMPRNGGSKVGASELDDDKAIKERFSGSTLSAARDEQDEVIEIWDVDRVVTVLNRQDVIEDIENPHKTRHRQVLKRWALKDGTKEADASQQADDEARGLNPFFFFRDIRRTSLFYAKGEIDAIAKPQELLNDFTNMESDAIIRQLAPQKELDPKYEDWIDLIDNEPDTVYPFTPGSLVDRPPLQIPGNSFNNRANLKAEIRETTALDQIMKGMAPSGDPTATQINAQVSQSSERIESKARTLEKDGLYWMAYILFRMFQLYVDKPLVVEVKGQDFEDLKTTVTLPDGTERELPKGAALLDPDDYRGDWRPKVTLEVDAQSKKAEEQTAARENYQIMIADPTNNLDEAKKRMYPKMFDLSKDDIDAIVTTDPAQQAPQMNDIDPATGAPLPPGGSTGPVGQLAPVEAPQEQMMDTGPELPVEGQEAAPGGDVDASALQQFLTPEELAQLQAAFTGQGAQA